MLLQGVKKRAATQEFLLTSSANLRGATRWRVPTPTQSAQSKCTDTRREDYSQQYTVRTHCRIRTEKRVSGCSDNAPTHSLCSRPIGARGLQRSQIDSTRKSSSCAHQVSAGDYSDERVALFARNLKFD
jgi:hypothetical protein